MKNKPTDPILDRLSSEYATLDLKIRDLRKEADDLNFKIKSSKKEKESSRIKLGFARDAMNLEFEKMQSDQREIQKAWDEYHFILDRNNPEIDKLKSQANDKASNMKRCFAKSQDCWQFGDKANAKLTFEKVKGDFDYIKNITRELIAKHQDVISRIRSIQAEKNQIKDKQQVRIKELNKERDKRHREKGSAWTKPKRGFVDGYHDVWFSVNKSTGEVLIADAKHVGPNGEGFHKAKNKPGKHNHYGKDKLGDGYFAKDRGYYGGPGH